MMAAGIDGSMMEARGAQAPAASSAVLVPAVLVPAVLASTVPPAEAGRERPRRGLALLLALAAGWGALFSYSLAYLSDEHPARPPSVAETGGTARTDPGTFELASELAARTTPPAAAEIPAESPPRPRLVNLRTDAPVKPAGEVATTPAPAAADRAEFVGTWGPTGAACGARSRRRGYLPATITQDGARAGRTICSFREGRRTGNAWQMAADCSERGRRWSSQVRLVVDGDRLTWTSGKGSSSYVRCGRRAG